MKTFKKFVSTWMLFAVAMTVIIHYVPTVGTWASAQVAAGNAWFSGFGRWARVAVETARPVFSFMSDAVPGFWHGAILAIVWAIIVRIAKKS
jgi:hypothetical protein